MKKDFLRLFCSILLLVIFAPAFSLEVDRTELESAGGEDTVVFINYEGPHQIINTIDQIYTIGTSLGIDIQTDTAIAQNTGEATRYYVIHAVDPAVTVGLDADILILGEDANVDHIDNLRRIIAAYLTTAYGYTSDNANTLSIFITVYNAVYRGQMDVFTEKYKPIVIENLTMEKSGLSINYEEWAGNTQIIIPIAALDGGLGTIDTTVISDTQVIESLQDEPDRAIEDRKDLVEIKEEEAEIATERAQEAQQEATVAKQEVVEETEVLEEVQEDAEIAQQIAEDRPNDPVAQENAEVAQIAVEQQETEVVQAQERVVELEQEAEVQQVIADTKQTDAQTDRIEIAKDQQERIRESPDLDDIINVAYGLKISDVGERLSTLVLIDTKTGMTVKESSVNVIRNRTIYSEGKDYIAVAGMTGGNTAVRLVKLDSLSMEIIDQSDEILALDSVLVKDAEFYYVILQDGSNYYTSKYDGNLELILKSDVAVLPETPITVTDLGIMVTDTYGFAKLLRTADLLGVEVSLPMGQAQ